MAEFTSAEKVNIGYENEYSTDAMTGGPDKRRQLYYQLIQSMKKAESVDIIVSFLMESGVRMLLKELEHTLKRGAKIRILTGNYLGITQPSALYLIKRKLGDRVEFIPEFQIAVQRQDHTAIHAVFHQGFGQSTRHITQTAGLGKGSRFAGTKQDIHTNVLLS